MTTPSNGDVIILYLFVKEFFWEVVHLIKFVFFFGL